MSECINLSWIAQVLMRTGSFAPRPIFAVEPRSGPKVGGTGCALEVKSRDVV